MLQLIKKWLSSPIDFGHYPVNQIKDRIEINGIVFNTKQHLKYMENKKKYILDDYKFQSNKFINNLNSLDRC